MRYISYTFPPANTQDVCLAQTLGAAGALKLNGNLANETWSQVPFVSRGYSRQISITTTSDLSARTFTVNGIQNGVSIRETITGPNNTIAYSTLVYDIITSITVDGVVGANVSVGTGWKGFFLISTNLERDVINYTLTVAKTTATAVQTAMYGTIDNIFNNGSTYLQNITSNNSIFAIKAIDDTDQFVYSNVVTPDLATADPPIFGQNPIYSTFLVLLGQSAATVANGMKITFIQT